MDPDLDSDLDADPDPAIFGFRNTGKRLFHDPT
jgi:hypothetical protein